MKINSLAYSIGQGLKNIRRNRMFSLASIGTIWACLFLFGIFYFLLANFQHIIKNAESSVGVTVFFNESVTDAEIEKIGAEIEARPEVQDIRFISAEEAWENFKEDYFNSASELTDTFADDNPLADSASYEVHINDISKQEAFVTYLNGIDGVRQVNSSDVTAKSLSSFNILVSYISAAIIIILIAVAVFLISTTVTMGISVRKNEISIMKMIGATDFFIRAPFIVEGVIIGLAGAILPLITLYFIYNRVIRFIAETEKFEVLTALTGILTFLDVNVVFSTLVPISLIIGIGIGFLGSYLTVRKHLRL